MTARLPHLVLALLAINLALRCAVAARLPVVYMEAYHWEWSRSLSLGYLDHPPLIAWLCRLSCTVFPDGSVWALRAVPLILGTGVFYLIHRVALQLFEDREVALRAVLIAMALAQLNVLGVLLLTDTALLFFGLIALSRFWTALHSEGIGPWAVFGVALGLTLLSKVMALLSIAGFASYLLASPTHRRWLRRPGPYVAAAIALAMYTPYLYWNVQHDGATFVMQLWTRHLNSFGFSLQKLGEVVFEQAASASFLLAVPLFGALFVRVESFPENWRAPLHLVKRHALIVLLFFVVAGAFTETHPQWTSLAYPPAAIALAALWTGSPRHGLSRPVRLLTHASLASVAVALVAVIIALPLFLSVDGERIGGSFGRGITKGQVRLFGWRELVPELEARLDALDEDPPALLFGFGYQETSMLSIQRPNEPAVVNIEAFTRPRSKPGDAQFHYLKTEELRGRSGLLVTTAGVVTREHLLRCFEDVVELDAITKRTGDVELERYRVFHVQRLTGLPRTPR